MHSLADLQARFARDLAHREAVALPGGSGAAGIDVYRNTIRANYRNALRATYPVVCALTALPFFHAAVDAFTEVHPSRGGDLNVYGDAFADFLAVYPHARDVPYLPDVARLEWAIDEACRAADDFAAPAALLAALTATPASQLGRQRFVLDASCRLLRSDYPVLRIWQAHQGAFAHDPGIDFDVPRECLLVRREAGAPAIERIAEAEFAWLMALRTGEDLAAALDSALAADPAFDLQQALRQRIGDGTLVSLRDR